MFAKHKNIFTELLSILKVKHTAEYSTKVFNEHPHKYNLFGLYSLLSDYNIEREAYRIESKENISELPTPFVAHFGGDFVVIRKIQNDKVNFNWHGNLLNLEIDEFYKSWSGVVLLTEKNNKSKEPDYKTHFIKQIFENLKFIALFAVILLSVAYTFINAKIYQSVGLSISLLLNLIGCYISFLLVQKQQKTQNHYADKICSLFAHADCNDVLETSAAKLFGLIGWSEIGLGYFISNIIIILFIPVLYPFLAWLSVFALGYSIWSLWYQKFKAKQWCALCVIVQLLFVLIFFCNLVFGFIQMPVFSFFNIILLSCTYIIPTLIIDILVPRVSEHKLLQNTTQELNSIKANEEVFRTLLKEQPFYEVTKKTSNIILGNPNSKLFITIFSNPHCNPCAKMHKRVENLLAECGDKICIQYIFSSFNKDLDESNKFMIAVYNQKSKDEMLKIYNEWFSGGKMKREEFFKKYAINMNDEKVIEQFERHEVWKEKTQLRATPTILVNGYKLPDNYKIEDLKFFSDFVL